MAETPEKKAYETPKLVRYGDLTEVTRNLTSSGKANDHANSSNKT